MITFVISYILVGLGCACFCIVDDLNSAPMDDDMGFFPIVLLATFIWPIVLLYVIFLILKYIDEKYREAKNKV